MIVNKYNNTIHRTIKMKPIEVTNDYYPKDSSRKLRSMELHSNKKDPLKLVTMLEFQNIKIFLLKDIFQIGQKKFLLLIKLKIHSLDVSY